MLSNPKRASEKEPIVNARNIYVGCAFLMLTSNPENLLGNEAPGKLASGPYCYPFHSGGNWVAGPIYFLLFRQAKNCLGFGPLFELFGEAVRTPFEWQGMAET